MTTPEQVAARPATEPSRPVAARAVLVALLAGAILVVGGLAAVLTAPATTYQSAATLAIDQPKGIAASADAGVIEKLSRLRFKYRGLVGTQAFARGMPGASGTGGSGSDGSGSGGSGSGGSGLGGTLFATVDPSSLLMQVGARGADPTTVRTLAQAAATHLVDYAAQEQERAGVPPEQRFVFQVVTDAPAAHGLGSSARRWGAVAAILGALVLAGAGGTWLLLRRR